MADVYETDTSLWGFYALIKNMIFLPLRTNLQKILSFFAYKIWKPIKNYSNISIKIKKGMGIDLTSKYFW